MCREAKILLVVSTLFTFASGLSGIFVSVFFWRQTNNFTVIVLYNLMEYIFTPLTFILAGIIAKHRSGICVLRTGLIGYALFYAAILFFGSKGIIYIYLLGVLAGIATGFYWLAFNTLCFDFTSVNNRDTFNGYKGSCTGVAAAIAPITSAYIISRFKGFFGYRIVFTITLSIFLILVLISIILKCKCYGSSLNYRAAFSRNNESWSIIRKSIFFWGQRDVIIFFFINILIIETTGSELSLGKLSLIAALMSSISYILVQKVIKPPLRKLSIHIGTIGAMLAVCGLIINIQYSTLLLYTVLDSFFLPFFIIQLSSSAFNVINKTHDEDLRIEYMINRDIALNGGRIVSSIILLILLHAFEDPSVMKVYLLLLGAAPAVSGYFLRRLSKVLAGEGK